MPAVPAVLAQGRAWWMMPALTAPVTLMSKQPGVHQRTKGLVRLDCCALLIKFIMHIKIGLQL